MTRRLLTIVTSGYSLEILSLKEKRTTMYFMTLAFNSSSNSMTPKELTVIVLLCLMTSSMLITAQRSINAARILLNLLPLENGMKRRLESCISLLRSRSSKDLGTLLEK